ncbi:hypothetical protein ACM66B_000344 [Microbotryomycetes sp. NB124-2]
MKSGPIKAAMVIATLVGTKEGWIGSLLRRLLPPKYGDGQERITSGYWQVRLTESAIPKTHPPPEHEAIGAFVKDGLENGIIRRSKSPWSSPLLLVRKKNGSYRCVDYRRLTTVTVKNAYPLPRIDDAYQLLKDAKFFTIADGPVDT